MEIALSFCIGVALAAACGFRVFVPLLVAGLAARTGHLDLGPGTAWIASDPAILCFAVASVVEIAAYYVPWIDHALDVIGSPAAVIAGILVSAAVFTGMDPWLKWTLAAVAGGGAAGTFQALTSGTRLMSTVKTLGIGNPVVATIESVGSVALSLLAIFLPAVAVLFAIGAVLGAFWLARRVV